MEPQGVVYKLTSRTSGKSYVGVTQYTAEHRFDNHVKEARLSPDKGCRYLNHAINRYGANDFDLEILTHCPIGELKLRERELIQAHGTRSPAGYNLTDGGEGFTGGDMPESARERLSANHRKHHADAGLPMYVANWACYGMPGYLVKVPGTPRAKFNDPSKSLEENKLAAIEYRNYLVAGGKPSSRLRHRARIRYDLPSGVVYNGDGKFTVTAGGFTMRYYHKGISNNLIRAMEYYTSLDCVSEEDWDKAYAIIEQLSAKLPD